MATITLGLTVAAGGLQHEFEVEIQDHMKVKDILKLDQIRNITATLITRPDSVPEVSPQISFGQEILDHQMQLEDLDLGDGAFANLKIEF